MIISLKKITLFGLTLSLLAVICAGCSRIGGNETQDGNPSSNTDSKVTKDTSNTADATDTADSMDTPDAADAAFNNTNPSQIKSDDTSNDNDRPEEQSSAPSTDSSGFDQSEYTKIKPEDAMIVDGIFLDVRTQEEYDDGHIPNAVLLPVDDIGAKAGAALPDRDRTIVVYCRSGARSERAARELIALGYKRVLDLGGIIDWTGEIIDAYGIISYNYFGTLPADKTTPIQFSTEQSISRGNDSLFTFTLEGQKVETYEISGSNPSRYNVWLDHVSISKITIENRKTGFFQELSGLITNNQHVNSDNMYGLAFDDWNFDGYMDISLWRYPGGSMRNNPTYYWLWDVGANMFMPCVELGELSEFSTPAIISETSQIYAYSRGGWAENMHQYYEWRYGQLVMVKSIYENIFEHPAGKPENLSPDDSLYVHRNVVHELRDGEMVLTEDYYFVWQGEEIVIIDSALVEGPG